MRWLIFKIKICSLFSCFFLIASVISAQDEYIKRIEEYKSKWDKLIPKYTKVQYAGGMGVMSFGTGWNYGNKDQWETDVFLGFLPKFQGDEFRITFTAKQNFIPWNVALKKSNFSFDPLTCGLYVNSILNGDYWGVEPDKYPNNYYSFSTKFRVNLCIGQRWTYHIAEEKRRLRQSITFYYELGTNELYLFSAFKNSYLKPKDYLKLSLGVKFQIL